MQFFQKQAGKNVDLKGFAENLLKESNQIQRKASRESSKSMVGWRIIQTWIIQLGLFNPNYSTWIIQLLSKNSTPLHSSILGVE